MRDKDQTMMWALIGGAAFVIMLYLNSSPAVQTGYVPPYIPYGAITGNPCPQQEPKMTTAARRAAA